MRLFVGATLVATKANGNKVACAAPVDSSFIPTAPSAGALQAKIVVESPSTTAPDGVEFRRTIVNVRFIPTASGMQRRTFQSQFGAQLIAVYPTFFRFRVPDVGASYAAFGALLTSLASHPAVQSATPLHSLDRVFNNGARYPNDGNGRRRQDYLSRNVSVWPASALRLPQAWGCETGLYGGQIPRIAIYEQNFPFAAATDVARSLLSPVVRITKWRDTMTTPPSDSNKVAFQNHGHSVAGMVSASGDDSVGIAGPLWKSDLRVFTFGNTNRDRGAGVQFFSAYMQVEIIRAAPRILSLSSSSRPDSAKDEREGQFFDAFLSFKTLLDSIPGLLIVQAVGNDAYQGAYSARDSASRDVFQEGLVMLRNESNEYKDRIVFVGETDVNGNRATESNDFAGLVDVYVPGFEVPVLLPDGTVDIGSGTSYAAPTVAGIAGQLLAIDPTLSAADLKALLLAGARDSVENSNGDNVAPSRVGNTSDVVYEADAFGSLRLLSSRAGQPLCGSTVTAVRTRRAAVPGMTDTLPYAVDVRRYGGLVERLTTTDADGLALVYPRSNTTYLSVAPGGRTFSTATERVAYDPSVHLFTLGSGVWTAASKQDGLLGMLFGERDTLLVDFDGVVFATSGSGRLPPQTFAGLTTELVYRNSVSFAPDGSAFAVASTTQQYSGTNVLRVVSRAGTQRSIPLIVGSEGTRTAWLPDAQHVLASVTQAYDRGQSYASFVSTLMRVENSAALVVRKQETLVSEGGSFASVLLPDAEGGRVAFVRSGHWSGEDCSIQSVRTSDLLGAQLRYRILPEPCGVVPPSDPEPPPGMPIRAVRPRPGNGY